MLHFCDLVWSVTVFEESHGTMLQKTMKSFEWVVLYFEYYLRNAPIY